MVTWSYLLTTGAVRFGGAGDPEIDPATEGKVVLTCNPDQVAHRINRSGCAGYTTSPAEWVPECGLDENGVAYVRRATAAELLASVDGEKNLQAGSRVDDLALRGLAAYVIQELNSIRAALPVPKPPLTVQDARGFVLAFVKARL